MKFGDKIAAAILIEDAHMAANRAARKSGGPGPNGKSRLIAAASIGMNPHSYRCAAYVVRAGQRDAKNLDLVDEMNATGHIYRVYRLLLERERGVVGRVGASEGTRVISPTRSLSRAVIALEGVLLALGALRDRKCPLSQEDRDHIAGAKRAVRALGRTLGALEKGDHNVVTEG